ncbi:hypothetical protein GS443_11650 [Rhodococcus hoagii]|nr:hypothetical protein [Prescottella equi]MBM4483972.1 hypothetical protein [Prescottella equi]MBM4483981.1 hypothetical protein [Prescottella equi]
MSTNQVVTEVLRAKLAEQPIVKRYANTVTTAIGVLVGALWLAIDAGVELPPQVSTVGLAIIGLGTLVGVKFTPNGVTEKQIAEIEEYAAGNVPRGE